MIDFISFAARVSFNCKFKKNIPLKKLKEGLFPSLFLLLDLEESPLLPEIKNFFDRL